MWLSDTHVDHGFVRLAKLVLLTCLVKIGEVGHFLACLVKKSGWTEVKKTGWTDVKKSSWTDLAFLIRRASGFVGRRGSFASIMLVVLFVPLLGACGGGDFKPLYGSLGANGKSVGEQLRHVDIAPIPGRVGQRIRNELIFGTTGGDYALDPKYRLEIAVRESVSSTLVQRTGDSTNQIYNIDARFRLFDLSSKKVVLEGDSYGRAGFERFTSIFANVRARKDAEDRAAKTVGNDLKIRISTYLASNA